MSYKPKYGDIVEFTYYDGLMYTGVVSYIGKYGFSIYSFIHDYEVPNSDDSKVQKVLKRTKERFTSSLEFKQSYPEYFI